MKRAALIGAATQQLRTAMTAINLDQQITCVARELKKREQVYPRWVSLGKMKPELAEYELEAIKAVLATLIGIQAANPFELE